MAVESDKLMATNTHLLLKAVTNRRINSQYIKVAFRKLLFIKVPLTQYTVKSQKMIHNNACTGISRDKHQVIIKELRLHIR